MGLVLASYSPCWSTSKPFVCSWTRRAEVSLSSDCTLSAYPIFVGLVRVPALQIFHEGSALISRFRLHCSLQSACHRHTRSDRSGTRPSVSKNISLGRSRNSCSQVGRCRSETSSITSSALVLSHRGFSSVDIGGEISPPSPWSCRLGHVNVLFQVSLYECRLYA